MVRQAEQDPLAQRLGRQVSADGLLGLPQEANEQVLGPTCWSRAIASWAAKPMARPQTSGVGSVRM